MFNGLIQYIFAKLIKIFISKLFRMNAYVDYRNKKDGRLNI